MRCGSTVKVRTDRRDGRLRGRRHGGSNWVHIGNPGLAKLSARRTGGRPAVHAEIKALITRMATANPLWGAPRIHGQSLKLGIDVAERTVSRLMPKRRPRPSQTWRTFLDNHVRGLVSVDFFTVPTARLRVLFVLVVLAHHRRRVVHFNVTEHSTAPGPPSRSWTPSRTTPRRQDAPERVGRGRVERWRARGSVRWLIHSFRRGPQSGSHSDVSSAPPKMPCIEFSPARLQAKVCCHQPGPSRPDPELKCQVHIPSGASRFDLTFVVDVPPADYCWHYQPARLRLTAATTSAHGPFAPSGL